MIYRSPRGAASREASQLRVNPCLPSLQKLPLVALIASAASSGLGEAIAPAESCGTPIP